MIEGEVGRLILVRFPRRVRLEEVDDFSETSDQISGANDHDLAFCADCRESRVMPPEVVDKLIDLMRKDNPRILRTVFITDPEATTVTLQLERMVRATESDARRVVTGIEDAITWLGEVLNDDEKIALRRFLED